MQASWTVAASAPPAATFECVHTWYTDFRQDLARVDVPTLVIHGDRDRIVPRGASGALTTRAIKGSRYVTVEGGRTAFSGRMQMSSIGSW